MKVTLKYDGKEILKYDTEFDSGIGHLMEVLDCVLREEIRGGKEEAIIEASLVVEVRHD